MKEKILSLLKEAPGELSGEELSRTLGVSRAAVWKAIEQLRREGCEIAASTRRGYRLLSAPETLSAERIGARKGDCAGRTRRNGRAGRSANCRTRTARAELLFAGGSGPVSERFAAAEAPSGRAAAPDGHDRCRGHARGGARLRKAPRH